MLERLTFYFVNPKQAGGGGAFYKSYNLKQFWIFKILSNEEISFLARAAFDNVGRLVMDDELNQMLSEVGGPCNYDNMIKVKVEKVEYLSSSSDRVS